MTNRYSVTVSITLEIDAESESDARLIAIRRSAPDGLDDMSAIWIDSVSKCKEGK